MLVLAAALVIVLFVSAILGLIVILGMRMSRGAAGQGPPLAATSSDTGGGPGVDYAAARHAAGGHGSSDFGGFSGGADFAGGGAGGDGGGGE